MDLNHKPLSYRALVLGVRKSKRRKHEEPTEAERLITGYTTRDHLILDLDKSHSLWATQRLVQMIQRDFSFVGDCLISESSWDGFHCIFDNKIKWYKILRICSMLQGLNIVNRDYFKVRKFREDLTLRVSSIDRGEEKSEAPIPKLLIMSERTMPLPIFQEPDEESTLISDIYGEKADVNFSGISYYLQTLAQFRGVELLSVHLSDSLPQP